MRRRTGALLVALVATAAALGSVAVASPATAGGTAPRVLVVGDSMGKQLATTMLLRPGYVTIDRTQGACSLSRGTMLGYNRNLYGGPGTNCFDWPTEFAQWAANDDPDVILLVIGGWDRPDRWGNTLPGPCSPGPWCPKPKFRITQPAGDERFLQAFTNAVETLRDASGGVPIVIATEPYSKPKTPTQGTLKNVYWEPYQATPPGPTAAWPKGWRAPMKDGSTPYISGRAKIDRINQLMHQAKATTFAGDPDIIVTDLNPLLSTNGGFMARVCPYPGPLAACPKEQRVRSRLSDNTHLSDVAQRYVLDGPGGLLATIDSVT